MNRLLLKVIASILALYFLFQKVEFDPLFNVIKNVEWGYLYFSLITYIFAQSVCAFKWKILAIPLGIVLPLKEFIFYYFVGMFFNLFLPTSIGGDMSKCYYLVKKENSLSKAAFSVLGERVTGATSLLMILIIGSSSLRGYHPMIKIIGLWKSIIFSTPLLASVIILGSILLLTSVLLPSFFYRVGHLYFFNNSWINRMEILLKREFMPFCKDPAILFKAIGLGLFFQLLVILIHISIGYSLGITLPILYYFVLYPIADLISFLPITLNGIGVREWSYTYLLTLAGVPQETAFGFSLLWFSILFLSSLMGGLVFVLGHFESPSGLPVMKEIE